MSSIDVAQGGPIPLTVVVCGDRDFTDGIFALSSLDRIHADRPIAQVIEGGERRWDRNRQIVGGADYWGYEWARRRKIPHRRVDAPWDDLNYPDADIRTNARGQYDANAGFRRNGWMVDILRLAPASAVIAFPGGAGTDDMVTKAAAFGIEIIRCAP